MGRQLIKKFVRQLLTYVDVYLNNYLVSYSVNSQVNYTGSTAEQTCRTELSVQTRQYVKSLATFRECQVDMEREVFDGVEKEYLLVAHSRSVGSEVSSQTAGRAIVFSGSANQR